ncbi:MAG: 4-hydroxythreonine-4-phosphate dehydrogenase PdxA [SAR202 cluster bacterium]|nr:4-hydroxythreonine-4-phosphate dehydrogenase PdxA [SAR202 cluster bacterium]MQG35812.1 4-hydroxythreonine-4-phosphate dehydrogenase PdxA [SAR202 cluster bacterium]MQG86632.1 4-hydroxythreonine-4-phosphate dehydrogenase PdxA [SAR202 cluster bacterium]|tara:strand:+ start:27 stop:1055 length:1029 start_codon:yes stop_codon:yes gene_type:complete
MPGEEMNDKPYVGLTMGDPCGIGPEVVIKALIHSKIYEWCNPVIIGNAASLRETVKMLDIDMAINHISETDIEMSRVSPNAASVIDIGNLNYEDVTIGEINPGCGKAAMEWVSHAGRLAMSGAIGGIATAPLNKEAASLAGYEAIGHMELLQELTGSKTVATMLIAKNLRVVHLTTHRSLRVACDYVKKDRILDYLRITDQNFKKWGFENPRIGVAALNPHGSDGGLLGDEENDEILPAVTQAKSEGMTVEGPIPADIIFHQAINDQYDAVLCMYHDQGHIPVKVYGFEESITANLGLPFVRTSVDHGTAFDIAGKGIADPLSMIEAIKLASTLISGSRLSS